MLSGIHQVAYSIFKSQTEREHIPGGSLKVLKGEIEALTAIGVEKPEEFLLFHNKKRVEAAKLKRMVRGVRNLRNSNREWTGKVKKCLT
jgi:hypothetical protein